MYPRPLEVVAAEEDIVGLFDGAAQVCVEEVATFLGFATVDEYMANMEFEDDAEPCEVKRRIDAAIAALPEVAMHE